MASKNTESKLYVHPDIFFKLTMETMASSIGVFCESDGYGEGKEMEKVRVR